MMMMGASKQDPPPYYQNNHSVGSGMNDDGRDHHRHSDTFSNASSTANLASDTTQPIPEVASALGIDGEQNKLDPRSAMADMSLLSQAESMQEIIPMRQSHHNRSAESGPPAHPRYPSGRFGDDESIPPPPSPRRPPRETVDVPPVVEAVCMTNSGPRSSHSQIPVVSEPPITQAIPVPGSDQPDACTSGILYHRTNPLDKDQLTQLRTVGYTEGLIENLDQLKEKLPLRFWLVDNSGSMLSPDGRELRGSTTQPYVVDCTRWAELQGTVVWHASLAGVLGTNTVFRLLNTPEHLPCPQEISVADPAASPSAVAASVQQIKDVMSKTTPKGFTPLTSHLDRIRDSVKAIQETLRTRGQEAVLVIATDGLPTDDVGDSTEQARAAFQTAVKSLQNLPVWIVIRLCTDDPEVVSYYNGLDKQLELSIEVIDDYFHEAEQVTKNNPWLNYAMPLHRCREMGFQNRIFDLLDERLLNKDELLKFLQLLFGQPVFLKAPDIHTDWKKFADFLQALLKLETEHFNPLTKKRSPWIDIRQLNKCYGGSGSLRNFFKRGRG